MVELTQLLVPDLTWPVPQPNRDLRAASETIAVAGTVPEVGPSSPTPAQDVRVDMEG
jgi:hypothetical protein